MDEYVKLGRIVTTPAAAAAVVSAGHSLGDFVRRHMCRDWGEVDEYDRRANDAAFREGGRLVSAYTTRQGERLLVITEADRSATTILVPDDY